MVDKFKIQGVDCICKKRIVTVKKSYNLPYEKAGEFCDILKSFTGVKYKRSARSWKVELIAHNMLYKAHMFIKHTEDTDFDEDESVFRKLCYEILYAFYCVNEAVVNFGKALLSFPGTDMSHTCRIKR